MKTKKARSAHVSEGMGYNIVQVLIYLFVGTFAISTILPFIYIIAGSFATERQLTENPFFVLPDPVSLNAYSYIFKTGDIFVGLKNSVFVTVLGTFTAMAVTSLFAYPVSRPDFKGRNLLLNMVIITMVFSGGMIPTYLVIQGLKLTNTFGALIIPGAMNAFNLVILKTFFQGIPKELEEAATLDGCSDLGIFGRIILPLAKPAIASISLFYAVNFWNDYFNAMLYISDPAKEVAQVALRKIVLMAGNINTQGGFDIDYGMFGAPPQKAVKMATTVAATFPILLVYPFVQKYFTQGVMVGAVKG